jgi:23S rRNA (guanosine2251-2'-O)-methyltransferase
MKKEFCTILNSLKSPQNVGMIVRTHVAYGGSEFIITGQDLPWRFKKGTQAFSRKLEKICNIQHIPDPEEALIWCKENGYSTVAIEITENPIFIDEFIFPQRIAIIVGNEGVGLESEFLNTCDQVVTIRQTGAVGSLNVAVSASIAMYEFNRNSVDTNVIVGNKYKEARV